MYKRIILTLDSSPLAEQAIPHAVAVAKAFDASLEIVTVVPVVQEDMLLAAGVTIDWELEVAHYEEYLKGVVTRIEEEGITVHSEVRRGDVAEEILRHSKDFHADLIVMSTHGRSGLGRWVYGSVADRVLRYASVPVLLVRAGQ